METITAREIRPGMTIQLLNWKGDRLEDVQHRHDAQCQCAPFVVQDVQGAGCTRDLFGPWDGDFRTLVASAPVAMLG